jgi:DNA polymerase-3 subunit alpha
MRTEILQKLKDHYDPQRIQQVDADFLSFEEDLTTLEDLQRVQSCIDTSFKFDKNPHNSIILYLTGLTNHFDSEQARANTKGGSPPDIDIDFEALGRDRAVEWVVKEWGRDHVANIMTQGTFKPKSLTRRFFKITEGDSATMREILRKFPKAVFGKEPKLDKIVESSPELSEGKYSDWLDFTTRLEGMTANFGIHPAGIIISGHPIPDTIPCMKNKKSELITQYDMNEVEELGSIKFDFLVINNLDILKHCVHLIKERHGKEYDIYDVPDFDKKAYALMISGLLTGVFQMETSGSAKTLIHKIEPSNLEELSDINALNRPGPMSAGLDDAYIENKKNGYAPADMPEAIAEVLKTTYWTLVYQEQVMALCTVAGFTLQEADDVRRAMGKKKHDILGSFKIKFVEGMVARKIDKAYAENLWVTLAGDPEDENNNGFAD